MFEKRFRLKENKTTAKTELLAGLTTFITMSYILAVNPDILAAAGMEKSAVLFATAVAAFAGCLLMGLLTNYPFALAPGMGLNAFFAYTVCVKMGYSYKIALLAVFVEGLLFLLLTVTHFREAIVSAIPQSLKNGISAGIGLFIVFIGFQRANIIVRSESTLVELVDFNANWSTLGVSAVLAIFGLMLILLLSHRKVRGAVLIGILATWAVGIVLQLTGLLKVGDGSGIASMIPDFSGFSLRSVTSNVGACFDFRSMDFKWIDLIVVVFTFLYMDMFDTMGTLIGVCNDSGLLDENGDLPRGGRAFLADSIATSVGALLGTSTTTSYIESSAGVAVGGRTGLTAVVTGLLFLLSVFLYPVFIVIPSFATAPAMIYVGLMMLRSVKKIDFDSFVDCIPALLCMAVTVLSYSVPDGIGAGVISYVVLSLFSGKGRKLSPFLYALVLAFIAKYILL